MIEIIRSLLKLCNIVFFSTTIEWKVLNDGFSLYEAIRVCRAGRTLVL